MNYKELLDMNESVYQDSKVENTRKASIVDSIDRTLGICEQNKNIIDNIDDDFLNKVRLEKQDMPFLFLAVALQTLRWILLPSLDLDYSQIEKEDRLEANELKHGGTLKGKRSGQRYEKPAINKYKNSHYKRYIQEEQEYRSKLKGEGQYRYLSWIEILFHPVPDDAMSGSENILIKRNDFLGKTTFLSPIGKQLTGKNHHVATLGHDPVLGWFFGTLNIMASMITFCDLQTYKVTRSQQLDKWQQTINYAEPIGLLNMLEYCIGSFEEDNKRLSAAVARQAMHMQSDKYTKDGLPIPLLNPELAQKLIDKGWNSNEMDRVLKKAIKNVGGISTQYYLAEFINSIIRSIYLLADPNEIMFQKVKIERILSISCVISEFSNVAVVAATRNISKLDIGGIVYAIHQIVFDLNTRAEIEMDYISNEFSRVLEEKE